MSFLDAESLICARLQEHVDAQTWTGRVPCVLKAADAANVEERSQMAPALYVVFDSYEPTQRLGSGKIQQVEQVYAVIVAVRNATGHSTSQGVRDNASPLIDLTIEALAGWAPSSDLTPLQMEPGRGPQYTDSGFGYFPLNFSTRLMMRGA